MTEQPVENGERRRRDADQTRRDILAVAGRQFARRGYSRVTLRDIADEVGITPALIVQYFGSKEGLFAAVGRDEWEFSDRRVTPLISGEAARSGAHRLVESWSDPDIRSVGLALVRSLDHQPAGDLLREELERRISAAWAPHVHGPDAGMRLKLIVGLSMGFGCFTTGALLDPDAPSLAEGDREAFEGYLAQMLDALLDPPAQ